MIFLKSVLLAKIILTIILWAFLPLFIPMKWYDKFGFPKQESLLFLRLLGMAYTALLAGYICGYLSEEVPQSVVFVGIISNGGGFLIMLYYGLTGVWTKWKGLARIYMWISTVFAFAIAVGLLASMI